MAPDPSSLDPLPTVGSAVDAALDALTGLADLAEDVDDEWQYIQDLSTAWRSRLEAVADERFDEALPPERAAAVTAAAAEAASVTDAHRAIDWLSTMPQVVLLALDAPS